MGIPRRLSFVLWLGAAALSGQTLSNASLTGKYSFREVLVASDSGTVQTVMGSLTFDGKGAFTFAGQSLSGSNPPSNANGNGTYGVQTSGLFTLSDPLKNGGTINARLGANALVGSNTEAGATVFSLFAAVPAPTAATNLATLTGTYWVASLEFLNGALSSPRETLSSMISNGSGSFGSPVVTGEAANLGNTQVKQTIFGATYTVAADGTGTATFTPGSGDPSQQLLIGAKTIYVSQDGGFFIGGGAGAGGQGFLIGIRTGAKLSNATLNGLLWTSDLYVRNQSYSSYAGSAYAYGDGNMTVSQRYRSTDGTLDVSAVTPYALNADGSGSIFDNEIAVSSDGKLFLGSGLATTGDTDRYELFFGIRAPTVTGSGLSLNPQAVFNVFSYAPAGNPISPGEFITIYGTGLPPRNAVAVPFPPTLNGVQLLINNTPASLYLITATQVFAVVPFSLTGPTATIVLNNNGTLSNAITVPVAPTAPGYASVTQNGLGAGAITHANYSAISASNPASAGEIVVSYLTGLGAVTPAVVDGTAPKVTTTTNSVQAVYVDGVSCMITFQGLAPGFAGLYQVNFMLPPVIAPGLSVPVALLTNTGFTDMVSIAIQ